jgi:hypothetical protein
LALEKNHPHARKIMRAYHHPNVKVEVHREGKKQDRVPDVNIQERNKL